ncbi:MAG: DEAD/DEAH box helicase [Candidatus Thorarchaeota archaeon]|nr:DEAD/DEAH box helicase [Candidatus Thorarchaeota archaeon]
MNAFSGLGKLINQFLRQQSITKPTEIQDKAIPTILGSKGNVLLLAPTGSGKTEAALLPLLQKLYDIKQRRELFGFYILYITPLRALNRDVFKRIKNLCQYLDLTVDVRHGDTTQYARRKQAIRPPNLLIITPETLQAILPAKRLSYHLKTVFAVVVDEIHELADSKRGVQLSVGLERLEYLTGTHVQRIGLSATVGNPKEVARLLGGAESDVNTIWAGYQSRKMNLTVEMPTPDKKHKQLARKISYPPHSTARLLRIMELITAYNSTIVFTNTRSFTEVLGAKMALMNPTYQFDVHHGSLAKEIRLSAENRLKNGVSKAIIATSSLELGIDIGQADLVIQYSSPREVSRALQRIGRAGHGVGRLAKGIVLATANLDDIAESGVILRRALANKVEKTVIARNPWDVLAHQICGILLHVPEMQRTELLGLLRRAYPFSDLKKLDLDRLLEFMVERKIAEAEGGRITRGRRTRMFYYEHLSTIPDVKQVNALDVSTQSSIGVLDEDYVTGSLETGTIFVIRGRPWQVVSIEENEVVCAPVTDIDIQAPRWIGEMIPVPYNVAAETARLWSLVASQEESEARRWLEEEYRIAGAGQEHLIKTVALARDELELLPLDRRFVIENFGSGLVLHAPLGTKANEALGVIIAALLRTRIGYDVAVESDPYRILLTSNGRLLPEYVVDILHDYNGKQVAEILEMTVKRTQTFASRFVHVGRRMGIIRRDAKIREIPVDRLIRSYENSPVFDEAMREVLSEKLDGNLVMRTFDRASRNEIEIHVVHTKVPSALARLIVEEKTRFEVIGEITDEDEILAMIEERLLSKKFRLVCMANGDWNSVRTLSTMEDDVRCPVCNSKMIAALFPTDDEFVKVVGKKVAGKPLSKAEEKKYRAGGLTATLVSTYGKRTLFVLAGRGLGPTAASRILHPGLTDRRSLLKAIAEAEKEYARTRPFWGN